MSKDRSLILHDVSLRENVLLRNVYLWMMLGLAITAGVAFAVSNSMTLMRYVVLNPFVTIAVFIADMRFGILHATSGGRTGGAPSERERTQ